MSTDKPDIILNRSELHWVIESGEKVAQIPKYGDYEF